MRRISFVIAALSLAGCTLFGTPAEPPPNWDVSDACKLAGDNLRSAAVGCPEADGSMGEPFAVICVRTSQRRPLPLGCWSSAKSAAEARGCGSLTCVHR